MQQPNKKQGNPWTFVWLKVIAKAWSEPGFRERLTAGDDAQVRELIKTGVHEDVPFPKWVSLKVEEAKDAVWIPDVRFWTLPDTRLTWRVMAKPSEEALAATLASFANELVQMEIKPQPEGAESPLSAFEQMIRWLSVWPQAIALAWKNPAFERHLREDPHAALYNAFGFQVPGGLRIIVEYTHHPYEVGALPPVELVLILPPGPKDITDGAIALGAYLESGRGNPLTLPVC
jgi:ribosomally synthesized peptide (two-chain TOMM family)